MKTRRLAGTRWRFLAHGQPNSRTGMYGSPLALSSDDQAPTVFDEVVVDSWLHVEQLDDAYWYVRLGGTTFTVRVDRDGNATRITEDDDGTEYPTDYA